jgi:hypothetical protein
MKVFDLRFIVFNDRYRTPRFFAGSLRISGIASAGAGTSQLPTSGFVPGSKPATNMQSNPLSVLRHRDTP